MFLLRCPQNDLSSKKPNQVQNQNLGTLMNWPKEERQERSEQGVSDSGVSDRSFTRGRKLFQPGFNHR